MSFDLLDEALVFKHSGADSAYNSPEQCSIDANEKLLRDNELLKDNIKKLSDAANKKIKQQADKIVLLTRKLSDFIDRRNTTTSSDDCLDSFKPLDSVATLERWLSLKASNIHHDKLLPRLGWSVRRIYLKYFMKATASVAVNTNITRLVQNTTQTPPIVITDDIVPPPPEFADSTRRSMDRHHQAPTRQILPLRKKREFLQTSQTENKPASDIEEGEIDESARQRNNRLSIRDSKQKRQRETSSRGRYQNSRHDELHNHREGSNQSSKENRHSHHRSPHRKRHRQRSPDHPIFDRRRPQPEPRHTPPAVHRRRPVVPKTPEDEPVSFDALEREQAESEIVLSEEFPTFSSHEIHGGPDFSRKIQDACTAYIEASDGKPIIKPCDFEEGFGSDPFIVTHASVGTNTTTSLAQRCEKCNNIAPIRASCTRYPTISEQFSDVITQHCGCRCRALRKKPSYCVKATFEEFATDWSQVSNVSSEETLLKLVTCSRQTLKENK